MTAKETLINDHNAKVLCSTDTLYNLKQITANYQMGLISVKEFNKQLADVSKRLNKLIIK